MIDRCSRWHIVALALALSACTSSHGPDDCPDVVGTCMDECCVRSATPTFDDACSATCPSGFRLIDRCAPVPGCDEDASCPMSDDAGAPPPCLTGACCDEEVARERVGCAWLCPAGSSDACAPDPAAFCAPPWLAACDTPADCRIAAAECCFTCSEPTLDDVVAIHELGATGYQDMVCPGGGACPPCAPPPYPYLVATCAAESCTAIDVRAHEVSACTDDEDCRLRVPACCECGATVVADQLIAIHHDQGGEYAALVCDLAATDCAACGAVYPDTVQAFCGADGHCAIRPTP